MKSRSGRSLFPKGRRGSRFALVAVLILVGSAIAVYNADDLYLAGRTSITSQLPTTLAPGANNTVMFVTTDASGEPEGDRPYTVEVEVNGTAIASVSGRTDARGFAAPSFHVPQFKGTAVLVVSTGGEVLRKTVTPYAASRVFLTTDKPIYQPGQVVHARVLVLRSELWETATTQGAEVTLEVKTPEGDRVYRRTERVDDFGVASFDYPLSDQLPQGSYQLKATVAGQEVTRDLRVEEYVLPRFEITFGELRQWYTFSEDVDAYALVKYFFGERVQGTAAITVNLFTGVDWRNLSVIGPFPLEDGVLNFTYDLSAAQSQMGKKLRDDNIYISNVESVLVEFNISVSDTGGHVEHDSQVVTVAFEPILLSVLADSNVEGQESTYHLIARYPDGSPVRNGTVEWTIHGKGNMPTVRTDDRGVAVLSFVYKGSYTGLFAKVTKDVYTSSNSFFDLKGSTGLKAISDRSTYDVGDVAAFDVFYNGDAASDLLYYDVVADGFTIATGHLTMDDGRAQLLLPVTSDFGRLTSVRFYKFGQDFTIARDVAVIGVAKEGGQLDISIEPEREVYMPQQPVSIRITVERDGRGVAAMLGVSIVDRAVYELGARFTGFEQVVAGLSTSYTDPLSQLMEYVYMGEGALPSVGQKEWDRAEAAPVQSTGTEMNLKAAEVRDDAVGAWWTIIAGLAIIGLVAVFALGPRTRHWKALLLVGLLVVAPALMVVGLYMNEGLLSTTDDAIEGDDVWFGDDRGMDWGAEMAEDETGANGGWLPPPAPPKAGGGDGGSQDTGGNPYVPVKRSITRQFFPETWAWVPVLPTDAGGVATLSLTAPDSVTSWDVSVIASTKDPLVGVAHGNVTVFQEFFVEPDLPAKAYLGDRFPLKVQVYNYGAGTNVSVSVAPDSWFSIDGPYSAQVELATGEVGYVEFTAEMLEVGVGELRVRGESDTFIDNVVRPLRVKPAGERITDMFQGRLSPGDALSHNLTLLPELIANSQNAWIKLQGGVEAAVIEGAEGFIHYVSGCGEQSLSTLSIDVLAFRAVREGDLDEASLMKLEAIVNQGINHELQYLLPAKNLQGRGIVWFPGDQDVHPWLTAWGVITFKDAQLAGFTVDDKIITDMQRWLKSQQKSDGSFVFPEWGIYEFNNPKLRSKTLATTAYVAHALVYSGVDPSSKEVSDAVSYVRSHIEEADNWKDPYVLAIGLKLLADAGDGSGSLAGRIADRLHELRTEDNGTTFWGSPTNMISNEVFGEMGGWGYWDRNPGFVIETTGYAAQALYGTGRHLADVEGAVKFLLDHRNELGGWFSTQDTVVAFQTVYYVSERKADVDMDVDVLVDGELAFEQHVGADNRDLTFLFDLRPLLATDTTAVELRATGKGFVMFQVFLEQWVPWGVVPGTEPLALRITYDALSVTVGQTITATAVVTNNQDRSVKMAYVELTAPVGMVFDTAQFDRMLEDGLVDNVELEDGMVRLYINDIEAGKSVTVSYTLEATMPAEVTLAGCRVVDMYNARVEMELPPMRMVAVEAFG